MTFVQADDQSQDLPGCDPSPGPWHARNTMRQPDQRNGKGIRGGPPSAQEVFNDAGEGVSQERGPIGGPTCGGVFQEVINNADADALLRRRSAGIQQLAYLRHDAVHPRHGGILVLAQDDGERTGQLIQQVLLLRVLLL